MRCMIIIFVAKEANDMEKLYFLRCDNVFNSFLIETLATLEQGGVSNSIRKRMFERYE